ncbi:MAG: hypothetical protein A3G34_10500 [Candidatus Lindowbacteria bacterium RIFCSPLOWO2_12_FULL_62_27]|nr:MAG: hypothetical protein A3G34_10500 [Candidatus Lindowbacteria bacterium RIFCSPLOWO2_12_FULL_62_27]
MALHFFKAAGGVGPIADDAGQSGAAIFDDVTFDGTAGQSRDQGLFVRNADSTKQYQNLLITIEDSDPVIDAVMIRMATTQAGLDSASPGASQPLPNIAAGPSETQMFVRVTIPPGTAVGNYVGIKLVINSIELAV